MIILFVQGGHTLLRQKPGKRSDNLKEVVNNISQRYHTCWRKYDKDHVEGFGINEVKEAISSGL